MTEHVCPACHQPLPHKPGIAWLDEGHVLHVGDLLFPLTPSQSKLMELLVKRQGHPVQCEALVEHVWFDRPECDWPDNAKNWRSVMLCHIRRRIGADAFSSYRHGSVTFYPERVDPDLANRPVAFYRNRNRYGAAA